jgi:hypothetical protein
VSDFGYQHSTTWNFQALPSIIIYHPLHSHRLNVCTVHLLPGSCGKLEFLEAIVIRSRATIDEQDYLITQKKRSSRSFLSHRHIHSFCMQPFLCKVQLTSLVTSSRITLLVFIIIGYVLQYCVVTELAFRCSVSFVQSLDIMMLHCMHACRILLTILDDSDAPSNSILPFSLSSLKRVQSPLYLPSPE